jgi:hypothetical protein
MRYLSPAEVKAQGGTTERQLTVSNAATPFGCCNFFDPCADGIMSLYYRPGDLKLLDWMGFNVETDCHRVLEFISFVRPEQDSGADTHGWISDPCADPNGIEFGGCTLSQTDFGRYGRSGPVRDLFKPEKFCKTRPRYFFDGSPVTDERQWDMFFTMDVLLNDIRVALITGNDTTNGQFDGLQRWVTTGYDCTALDSYVVDWNGNDMDGLGGGAITLNGAAAPAGFNIVDWLLDLLRNIKQRISWSPMLNNQNLMVGDIIILLPSFMARCLLDFYTCWSVCPEAITVGTNDGLSIDKPVKEMREFRLQLNGGLFGDGRIFLDGLEVPLLAYDWGLINGPTTGDMYLLTGAVGNQRIWEGGHLDANVILEEIRALGGDPVSGGYSVMDGGRFAMKQDFDNLCSPIKLWMRNRIWCSAPWAQVRFQDVVCRTPTGPLSPNPADTSFFPESSFSVAECP